MKRSAVSLALAVLLLAGCTPAGSSPSPTAGAPGGTPGPAPTAAPAPTPGAEAPLRLTRAQMPALDGSTSTVPLAKAVCAVLLGETVEQVAYLVNFSRSTASYRNLMEGGAQLLIAAEPAQSVVEEKEAAGFAWEMAPIATDALVFLVNEDNPVDSLSAEQVRGIYTGAITNWKQVGGEDRPILPFQRNAEAGSQTMMKKLVMGDTPLMEPEKEYLVDSMAGLIEAVRSFDGSPGAIGYTVYYYANDMNMADGLKVVSIDGVPPAAASIRSGAYPFTNPYYAVIAADEPADSPARQIYHWLQGPVGQSLIEHEGYVAILDDPAPVEWDLGETEPVQEVYTRLSAEPLPQLTARQPGYGPLLTYVGSTLPGNWWAMEYDRYGLVSAADGCIVTDSVYDTAYKLSYFDNEYEHGWHYRDMGVYALGRADVFDAADGQAPEKRYALAAEDGSWCTGLIYSALQGVAPDYIWAEDTQGNGLMLDGRGNLRWQMDVRGKSAFWEQDCHVMWSGGTGQFWYEGDRGGMGFVTLDGQVCEFTASQMDWADPQSFSDGLCAARKQGEELWGYLNEQGEWAIPPVYTEANTFECGVATVRSGEGSQLIDREGNVLLRTGHELVQLQGDEGVWYLAYQGRDPGGLYAVEMAYDQNLTPMPNHPAVGKSLHWGMNGTFYLPDGDGLELYTKSGVRHISGGNHVNSVEEGLVVLYMVDDQGDIVSWSAATLEGETVLTVTEWEYMGITTDPVTGESYLYVGAYDGAGGSGALYDRAGNFLTTCGAYGSVVGGLIEVRTELSYGYKDLAGNWRFRISLMKSKED